MLKIKSIDKNTKTFLIKYTALFFMTAFLVFIYFIINEKSFVWEIDGYSQHYKALVYYAQWLREIAGELILNQRIYIPTFSFSFGLGSDLFTILQYYVIGDPLTIFSIFVPTKYMIYFYNFLVIFRLYLSGLSFYAYARYNKKTTGAILAGSLTYVFSFFALYSSVRHPYFIAPMIYLPLMLLGVKKIRKENKPFLMIASVLLSLVSNFYFSYMLVLLVILYVGVTTFVPFKKDEFKASLLFIFRVAKSSLLGALIGMLYFLPVLTLFLSDARSSISYVYDALYSYRYYINILPSIITTYTPGDWLLIGVSSTSLLALFLLFLKKEERYKKFKVAFFLVFLGILIPFVGYAFNGFGYVSNRWSFGLVFLFAYILTEMWEDLQNLSRRELKLIGISYFIYFLLCSIAYLHVNENFYFAFSIGAISLFALSFSPLDFKESKSIREKRTSKILLSLIILNIAGSAFYLYSPNADNYVKEFKSNATMRKKLKDTQAKAVGNIDDSADFYRLSNILGKNKNLSIFDGSHTTQAYWSLGNGNVADFNSKNLVSIFTLSHFQGFDSRTFLEALASTKYFVTKSKDYETVPYGFKLVNKGSASAYSVYENEFALPFAYTYSKSITEEEAEKFSVLDRQNLMLQAVILDEKLEGFENNALKVNSEKIDYNVVSNSKHVTVDKNKIIVTKAGESATLSFEGLGNSESYLAINDLSYEDVTTLDLYHGGKGVDPSDLYSQSNWNKKTIADKMKIRTDDLMSVKKEKFNFSLSIEDKENFTKNKEVVFHTPYHQFYNNRKDFLINLGYSDAPIASTKITFPVAGIYSFDEIEVLAQPMENYEEQVNLLKEDVLENVNIHANDINATNRVTGNISLEEPKILLLTIPYSKGWTAYVNGEEVELLKANTGFMAIPLEAGDFDIELKYQTPGLFIGLCLSGLGLVILGITVIVRRKKVKETA